MEPNKPKWVFSDVEQDKWLDGPFAIIADAKHYFEREYEIRRWLDDNVPGWSLEGVVLRMQTRDQLTMFRLRWDDSLDG